MRIAINSRSFLNPNYTGIGRYTFNLVKSLLDIDQANNYLLYVPKSLFDRNKRVPTFKASNLRLKRDYFKRGIHRVLPNVDLYHSPSPDVIPPMKAKVIVTVHDLVYKAFPAGHTSETLQLTDQQIKSFLPHVSKIICCSEHTRKDLHHYFDVDQSKTCVVYQGVDKSIFYPLDEAQKVTNREALKALGIVDPFILFVGTIEPRKNLKGLLHAFAELRKAQVFQGKLVVAGMKGWKSDDVKDLLKSLNIEGEVIFLGFIGDNELRALYNLCEVFVFPSFYEGFGYPLLEAFSCGAAVVASNRASCSEITQDAAVSINPDRPQELIDGIRSVLQKPDLKQLLQKRASRRAQDFSFEKTARETLAVYRDVYESA